MIIELIILAGLFLIFIGMLSLIIINFLEARELSKQSERLEASVQFYKDCADQYKETARRYKNGR